MDALSGHENYSADPATGSYSLTIPPLGDEGNSFDTKWKRIRERLGERGLSYKFKAAFSVVQHLSQAGALYACTTLKLENNGLVCFSWVLLSRPSVGDVHQHYIAAARSNSFKTATFFSETDIGSKWRNQIVCFLPSLGPWQERLDEFLACSECAQCTVHRGALTGQQSWIVLV